MLKSYQFNLKTIGCFIVVVSVVLCIPSIALISVALFGFARVLRGLQAFCFRKSFQIRSVDHIRLTSLCLLYFLTLFFSTAHFHRHVRTQVSGGCFKVAINSSDVWGGSPRWRFGPASDARWINMPSADVSRTNGGDDVLFLIVPFWIPILLLACEIGLARLAARRCPTNGEEKGVREEKAVRSL